MTRKPQIYHKAKQVSKVAEHFTLTVKQNAEKDLAQTRRWKTVGFKADKA